VTGRKLQIIMLSGTRFLLLTVFLVLGNNLFSQQLSQQVLVPVAGVTSVGSINYSQTIGETAVEIISGVDYIFTQGFQQPGFKLTIEPPHAGNGFNIYPNPATDHITIKLFGDIPRDFRVDIINLTGVMVYSEKFSFTEKFYLEKVISVSNYNNGVYYVRIMSSDKEISRTFIFEKM
jgi:hypothetical protein